MNKLFATVSLQASFQFNLPVLNEEMGHMSEKQKRAAFLTLILVPLVECGHEQCADRSRTAVYNDLLMHNTLSEFGSMVIDAMVPVVH